MGPTTRVVIALSAALLFAGRATAEGATFSAVEETAIVGPEAAAVLLSTGEDDAVVGSAAAAVLLGASEPVETPARKSGKAAKLRRNGRQAAEKAALSSH
jgi:hypothetical protein